MKTTPRSGVLGLAFLAALSFASHARAYTYLYRTGCPGDTGAAWPQRLLPSEWKIHSTGYSRLPMGVIIETLQRSVDVWGGQWGQPCCSGFTNRYSGMTEASPLASPIENVVGFIESNWPRSLGSPWATIAVTLPLIDRENCEITSADMVFNGERFVFRTDGNLSNAAEVDFESIAIHEFGHWIGLDHSRNPDEPGGYEPASVMFPSYRGGVEGRKLFPDDMLGACALYPAPCGNCASNSDCPDGTRCEDGDCVRVQCVSDASCPPGSVCGPDRQCHRGCRLHAECGPGQYCAGGACLPKVTQCTTCRLCGRDSQCGPTADHVCLDLGDGQGRCTKLCASDDDCDGDSVCRTVGGSLGVCGAPNSAEICPSSYVCDNTFCPSLGDRCGPTCGARSDTCVFTSRGALCSCTCFSDADCPNGRCVQNPHTGVWSCYPEDALTGCGSTFCPEGTVCVDGSCLVDCDGQICDQGEICESGQCRSPCGDCPAGTVCDPARRTCRTDAACLGISCGPGQRCVAGTCQADAEGIGRGSRKKSGGCSTAGDGIALAALALSVALAARRNR